MVSADVDTDARTVTVVLRDENVSIGTVAKALTTAGFATGEPVLKDGGKK